MQNPWVIVLIVAAVLCFVVYPIVWSWRSGHHILLFPLHLVHFFYTRVVWGAKVKGVFPIPRGQGCVMVCNHRSSIDPVFIELASHRPMHWMVAKEYFSVPGVGFVLRILGCIPVSRGGVDTAVTKQAIRLVEQGKAVGLLPEGRINQTKELLLPGRPGAALVALRAAAPVVPCYIEGSPYNGTMLGPFFMRAKVRITIGPVIDMTEYHRRYESEEEDRKALLVEVTLRFLREIATLAGQPNYEPQVAGKNWKTEKHEEAA